MVKFTIVSGPSGYEVVETATGRAELVRDAGAAPSGRELRIEVSERQAVPSLKFTSMVGSA